jgi:hypothetical protein
MITIINLHRRKLQPGEVYIGRSHRFTQLEPSPLANPFKLNDESDRLKVLEQYRVWLDERLMSPVSAQSIELARLTEIARAGDLVLACWCSPAVCHGDIVKLRIEERLQEVETNGT